MDPIIHSSAPHYLFGPVPSRRLGRSLGVDLVPFKTCTMNCRFCQLGDHSCAVSERKEYVPTAAVLDELAAWVEADGAADHITLAGSGEPTLHTGFGTVFRWIRAHTEIPSVLLSNGSLMWLPEVRAAARLADKVKVTMSAWDETSFQCLHRPAVGLSFEQLMEGERAFRAEFNGELSVEVFIVAGVNSDAESARRMAEMVETLAPDRIDLNTAVRPPADGGVAAVSESELAALAPFFGAKAVVAASFPKATPVRREVTAEGLLSLIRRHPATAEQLAQEFGVSHSCVMELLQEPLRAGDLSIESRSAGHYFFTR